MEPDEADVWIVPNELEKFLDVLGLGEDIGQGFDFNLADVSLASVRGSSGALPVVHTFVGRVGEATRLLTVHVDHVGIAGCVNEVRGMFGVDLDGVVFVGTANPLVFDLDLKLRNITGSESTDHNGEVELFQVILVFES